MNDQASTATAAEASRICDMTDQAARLTRAGTATPVRARSPGSRKRGHLAQLSYQIIREHGGDMRVRDLLVELVAIGRMTGTHADYATVFATLKRNRALFEKLSPGRFAVIPRTVSDPAH